MRFKILFIHTLFCLIGSQHYLNAAFPINIEQPKFNQIQSLKNTITNLIPTIYLKDKPKEKFELKNQHQATLIIGGVFLASILFGIVFPPLGEIMWLGASIGALYCVFRKDANRFDKIVGFSIIGLNVILVFALLALLAFIFALP